MTLTRKYAKNVFFKGAGEALVRLFSFAFVVLVARVVGDAHFGALNFAFSFALLFVVIVDFGLNPLLVRDAARDATAAPKIFHNLLLVKIILALVFLLAIVIGLLVVRPDPAMVRLTYWMAGFVLLNSFTEFMNAVFNAQQEMQLEAMTMSVQKAALLLLGITALKLGWDVEGIAVAYLLAGVAGLCLALGLLWKKGFLRGGWRLDPVFLRYAWREALPLTLTTLFVNLYFRIDMTLLAKFRPAAEIGWYSAAHKCIEVLMVLPAVLVVASFPGFAKLFHEDKEKLKQAALKLARLLLLLGMPLAGGAIALGQPLLVLFFGDAYAPAGKAFAWLTTALALIFLNYIFSYLLISGEKQKANAVIAGLAVVVSVGSNLLFIPRFGYLGAAMSAVLTELFLFAGYYYAVQRWVLVLPLLLPALRVLAATAIMLAAISWLRHADLFLVLAAGALVYAGAIWLVKAIDADDLKLMKKIFVRS